MSTQRFQAALSFAAEKHSGHMRKGTDIPYIAHLLAVTALVLEYGGDEDQAIAALLHDCVEDCGGPLVLEEIRQAFGDRVAGMVDALSDAAPVEGEEKAPWKERKTAYLEQLPSEPPEVLLISACDKLHNARAILDDLGRVGLEVFERFKPSPEETLWYYRSLVEIYESVGPEEVGRALGETVAAIERRTDDLAAEPTRG